MAKNKVYLANYTKLSDANNTIYASIVVAKNKKEANKELSKSVAAVDKASYARIRTKNPMVFETLEVHEKDHEKTVNLG